MKFLTIESNKSIADDLARVLSPLGESENAYDGEEGLYMAEVKDYDMIVLDAVLPKLNGFAVLDRIRKFTLCPVLIVTALDSVEKKVEGLKLGADDYIVCPYNEQELEARAEAVLRRYNNNFSDIYAHDNVKMDFRSKMFSANGEYVKISGKMYDLLEHLIRNRNIIISKEQLFNRIWGFDSETIITVTEVYVSKLRKILDKYGIKHYLCTIKNIGYMWHDKDENIEKTITQNND